MRDSYYLMDGDDKSVGSLPLPIEIKTLGQRRIRIVFGKDLCWPLEHLVEDGYTFTPLVAMTPERVEALRYILANSLDEYNETLPETQGHLATLRAMLAEMETTNGK